MSDACRDMCDCEPGMTDRIDDLESQLADGESWGDRIQRDPLFAARFALIDCSEEVVNRTEYYTARIEELERREALTERFVILDDALDMCLDSALTLEDTNECTELIGRKETARAALDWWGT